MNQDINSHVARLSHQFLIVTPRYDLMSIDDTYFEATKVDSLLLLQGLICAVAFTGNDVEPVFASDLDEVILLILPSIACAQHHLNLVGIQELLQACWNGSASLGDVKIAY